MLGNPKDETESYECPENMKLIIMTPTKSLRTKAQEL